MNEDFHVEIFYFILLFFQVKYYFIPHFPKEIVKKNIHFGNVVLVIPPLLGIF